MKTRRTTKTEAKSSRGLHRAYVADFVHSGEMHITGDEAHHIAHVKRLGIGDRVVVFDGSGLEAEAAIVEAGRDQVIVRVEQPHSVDREAGMNITLACAIPKGKRAEFMIQKCAELGVRAFIPIECARSVVNIRTRTDSKLAKWERICAEASKQSGRNRVMAVRPPHEMAEVLRLVSKHHLALIATRWGDVAPLRSVLEGAGAIDSVLYLVGPEGGFTRTEIAEATRAGCKAVSLASSILRTETAAVAGVAMLVYAAS
ncbi:MAG: 16S rRNA (uracil(1498)-N(3))-methyltransferase [Planctomycetes bacterium]|nr:16S rRNA (uracil(1498)-N(3))-methyltransferase [Planctomycetota bacterium]